MTTPVSLACEIKDLCLEITLVDGCGSYAPDLDFSYGFAEEKCGPIEIYVKDSQGTEHKGVLSPGGKSVFFHNLPRGLVEVHSTRHTEQDEDDDPRKWNSNLLKAASVADHEETNLPDWNEAPTHLDSEGGEKPKATELAKKEGWWHRKVTYAQLAAMPDCNIFLIDQEQRAKVMKDLADSGQTISETGLLLPLKPYPKKDCPTEQNRLVRYMLELAPLRSYMPALLPNDDWSAVNAHNLGIFSAQAYAGMTQSSTKQRTGSIWQVFSALAAQERPHCYDSTPADAVLLQVDYPLRFRKLHLFASGRTNTQAFAAVNHKSMLIAARGTQMSPFSAAMADLSTDLNFPLVAPPVGADSGGRTHQGFTKAFNAIQEELAEYVKANRQGPYGERQVFVAGHSLGGALATLIAWTLKEMGLQKVFLYTYGSPRVGTRELVKHFNQAQKVPHYRHVSLQDPIPALPPRRLGHYVVHTLDAARHYYDGVKAELPANWRHQEYFHHGTLKYIHISMNKKWIHDWNVLQSALPNGIKRDDEEADSSSYSFDDTWLESVLGGVGVGGKVPIIGFPVAVKRMVEFGMGVMGDHPVAGYLDGTNNELSECVTAQAKYRKLGETLIYDAEVIRKTSQPFSWGDELVYDDAFACLKARAATNLRSALFDKIEEAGPCHLNKDTRGADCRELLQEELERFVKERGKGEALGKVTLAAGEKGAEIAKLEKTKKELEAKLEKAKKNFDIPDPYPTVEGTYAEIERLEEQVRSYNDKISRLNKDNGALLSEMEKIRETIAQ